MKKNILFFVICCLFCVVTSYSKTKMNISELKQIQTVILTNAKMLQRDNVSTVSMHQAIANLGKSCMTLKNSKNLALEDFGGKCIAELNNYNDNVQSMVEACSSEQPAPINPPTTPSPTPKATFGLVGEFGYDQLGYGSFGEISYMQNISPEYYSDFGSGGSFLNFDQRCENAKTRSNASYERLKTCLEAKGLGDKLLDIGCSNQDFS